MFPESVQSRYPETKISKSCFFLIKKSWRNNSPKPTWLSSMLIKYSSPLKHHLSNFHHLLIRVAVRLNVNYAHALVVLVESALVLKTRSWFPSRFIKTFPFHSIEHQRRLAKLRNKRVTGSAYVSNRSHSAYTWGLRIGSGIAVDRSIH